MPEAESKVRIACLQMEPKVGEKHRNLERSLEMIDQAGSAGASLVVLPELCNSGYVFETRAEAGDLAEEIPGGPTCKAWAEAAARFDLHLVAGIAERDGRALYNSAVLIGPKGVIGTYRKNHLWAAENLFFEPGNLGVPVFHSDIGRIAIAICYDIWFPEIFRLAALQGADVLCVPTNWVPMPEQPDELPKMSNILAMAGCACQLHVRRRRRPHRQRARPALHRQQPACQPHRLAARGARQRGLRRDPDRRGEPLRTPGAKRNWNDFNQVLRDRRIDVYAETLGADIRRGWY